MLLKAHCTNDPDMTANTVIVSFKQKELSSRTLPKAMVSASMNIISARANPNSKRGSQFFIQKGRRLWLQATRRSGCFDTE
jgi:hypothetical protein